MQVDYSVYLVTDNTPAILGDKDIVEVVRAAVEGGANVICFTAAECTCLVCQFLIFLR